MRRLLLLLALAVSASAASCRSNTTDDALVVTAYLENAAQYYDAGHYDGAFQQWQRALDLDPDEERAKLGQAMCLYQLGREDSREGVQRLQESERRLDELREGGLGDQSWKAEIGYALVQQRWTDLYEKAIRIDKALTATGRATDPEKRALAERELPGRVAAAEKSFRAVLADTRAEPNLKMTCWLGLARMTALRGAYEESLEWCRRYEKEIVRSAAFWEKQGETYASKLFGARLQEAELRDVLANTLFKLGKFEDAERELDRLVAIQPNRADAYLNRGMLRETRAAWDLAQSDFGKFLDLTDRKQDDPVVLEVRKRRLLCEDRVAAEDQRVIDSGPAQR